MTDKEQHDKVLTSIDVLIKSLGTMVIVPKYERADPMDLGSKEVFAGTIQQPILQGAYRETALAKLDELIKTL